MLKDYQTGKAKKIAISLAIILILGATVAIIMIGVIASNKKAEFIPPPFETNAQVGTPTSPADVVIGELPIGEGEIKIGICAPSKVIYSNEAQVYLTNPSTNNNVLAMVKIIDKNSDKELGKTGLIKPGEYVERVTLETLPKTVETDVILRVMLYQPETYISEGEANLNSKLVIAN